MKNKEVRFKLPIPAVSTVNLMVLLCSLLIFLSFPLFSQTGGGPGSGTGGGAGRPAAGSPAPAGSPSPAGAPAPGTRGTTEDEPTGVRVRAAEAEISDAYTPVQYGARVEPSDRFSVRAPISGIIENIFVKEGDRVREGDLLFSVRRELSGRSFQAAEARADRAGRVTRIHLRGGDPVSENGIAVTLLDDSTYKIVILVGAREVAGIRTGDQYVLLEGGTRLPVRGRVSRMSVEPDYQSGLFDVELSVPRNPAVRIGQFLRVEVRKNPFRGIVVETVHLTRRYGNVYLQVLRADSTIELREVETGEVYGDRTAILSGVNAGEKYVIWSERRLQNGDRVAAERQGMAQ